MYYAHLYMLTTIEVRIEIAIPTVFIKTITEKVVNAKYIFYFK